MASDVPAPADAAPASGPPSKAARNVVVTLAIGFFVLALAGDTFLLANSDRYPELFIAMNARNRNLVLVKPELAWWAFFGIATVRLLVSDPLFFLLGRWYGDAGVRWIERRSATYGPLARTAERWFGKASYPLIVIAPNNYLCLFAGAGGMSVPVFAVLNVAGTVGRLTVLWFASDWIEKPLDLVRDFITDNRWLVFGISLGLLALSLWTDRRAGGGEVTGLLHIDEEIAELEAEDAPGSDGAPPADGAGASEGGPAADGGASVSRPDG
ncbi:MAG: DedA family protein [Iamia sp.]